MSLTIVLPSLYLQQLGELVDSLGGDFDRCLAAAGLQRSQLDTALLRLPWRAFQQLVEQSLSHSGRADLGLLLGERLPVQTHGVLGYAAMNATTLRDAIDLLVTFLRVRITLLALTPAPHADGLRLQLTAAVPLGATERFLAEAVLLAIKHIFDFITRDHDAVTAVAFDCAAPDNLALAQTLFRVPVHDQASWTGLVLDRSRLDVPLRLADPMAFESAQALCRQTLEQLSADDRLGQRIRRYLLERQGRFPTLEEVCRQLHMTPRTLHRHLAAEGTSFKQLSDDLRHMLAVEHLRSGRVPLQELAYLLGYSDMANFRRAFRRWEGVPPSEFLAALQRNS